MCFKLSFGLVPFPESKCPDVRHLALQIENRGHEALLNLFTCLVESHADEVVSGRTTTAKPTRESALRRARKYAHVTQRGIQSVGSQSPLWNRAQVSLGDLRQR
ncbi:MAG TPA: hypothetical protein VE994_15995, partial [Terriglobales bacterium]|nr:hypothetical protein [Terriglobales bacterium]